MPTASCPVPRNTDRALRNIAEGSAQYRRRYAEPEAALAALCPGFFDFVMVVPVCAEPAAFVDGYRAAVPAAGRLLLIVVLNGREGADDAVHASNAECFRELNARFTLHELGRGGWLSRESGMSVLVVDRFTADRRLPSRQGVGLARKIGADVALELIAAGGVRHPFVAMTDADARLPEDYFRRIADVEAECSAAVFPMWHEPSGRADIDRGTALYEIRLRYFQRGLQWAHSPSAFHTVGSTMAVHALCYAQVRGVPRRRAGEDFYLLSKLSKLRPVARLRGEPVRLRSRFSDRVPFGTGSESGKLARGGEPLLYHPACFAAVREVTSGLRCLSGLLSVSKPPSSGPFSAEHGASARGLPDQDTIDERLSRMSAPVRDFLESQGVPRTWRKLIEQAPNPAARLRRFHDWFDGFRTLKLIHHVRDHAASSLPWQDAIRLAPFMDDVPDDGASLSDGRTELLRLEQSFPRLVGPGVER